MTFIKEIEEDPASFDFFTTLRMLERSSPNKPIIGDNALLSEQIVKLTQKPFIEFPASNISKFENPSDGVPELSTRFIGFFGPQGALPLSTTLETLDWQNHNDDAFIRFTEIFSTRFQELFFRAWGSSKPIVHIDRPDEDRFLRYIGSFIGIGSSPYFERDSVKDIIKIPYAGMISTEVKSASRLQRFLKGVFKVDIEIQERIPSWLIFETDDCLQLGTVASSLGGDTFLGKKVLTINEKIRISIKSNDLKNYETFLPGGENYKKLVDLIVFYIGYRFEFELELSLIKEEAPATQLSKSGKLGWTSWVAPKNNNNDDKYFRDTKIIPLG